jgi:putative ATPase
MVHQVGMPEGRIPLSECTLYLATSPKSNSAYMAIDEALAAVRATGDLPVPLHLRNAPTKLMKELGYGLEYQYAHQFEGNFILQEYLPKEISAAHFYQPGQNPKEKEIQQWLEKKWGNFKNKS